ncbi:MAG TPA: zinc ribbon domain-containing protein [Chloroflexia bacterium]|nr:zinc ribbon domain-containing protein [Chloroflexia bacterium]
MTLVLDGILIVVLVLFALAGLRRGPWPEVVTLGGLLLGALLADEWGDTWGGDLGNLLGVVGPAGGKMVIRALLFLVPLLLIGYGGALLLPASGRLGFRARLAGAGLGLFNGVAIFAILLRNWYYSQGSPPGSELRTDPGTGFLLEWAGWWPILLAAGGIIAVLAAIVARPRPVRRPVPVTIPAAPAGGSVPLPPPRPGGTTGGGIAAPPPTPFPRPAAPALGTGTAGPAPAPGDLPPPKLAAPLPETRVPPPAPEERRCRTCGKVLAPGAAFCPNCGTPV